MANVTNESIGFEKHVDFDYHEAFSRNIGWLTDAEQESLRHKKIAIAGMGGVGGVHLLTLTRLGIGNFNIADFDIFEIGNFNRQAGATISNTGEAKLESMKNMALDINLELKITEFKDGVNLENIDAFLEGVDLYIDGLDFFVLDIRREVFKKCHALDIPAITAAPLGMGAAYLNFLPGKMSFEEYFQFEKADEQQRYVNFILGLAPKAHHKSYLADPSKVDFIRQKVPSTIMGCQLCAGIAATEALKILLNRGKVYAAPHYHHFDAYKGKWTRGYIPFGLANPWQKFKRKKGDEFFKAMADLSAIKAEQAPTPEMSSIEKILHIARWAPSGDNVQPWRFSNKTENSVTIKFTKNEANNPFEHDGYPIYLAAGGFLETMEIAASQYGQTITWTLDDDSEMSFTITTKIKTQKAIKPSPLLSAITTRQTKRTAYSTKPLSAEQISALENASGDLVKIQWHHVLPERFKLAKINAMAMHGMLTLPSMYDNAVKMLDWKNTFSKHGIPIGATGLSLMGIKALKWALKTPERIQFANKYLAGTVMPKIELGYIPGLFCASHFTLHYKNAKSEDRLNPMELIESGKTLQRFWLTAEKNGISLQPVYGAIAFTYNLRKNKEQGASPQTNKVIKRLNRQCTKIWDGNPDHVFFQGRLGFTKTGATPTRSARHDIKDLMDDKITYI